MWNTAQKAGNWFKCILLLQEMRVYFFGCICKCIFSLYSPAYQIINFENRHPERTILESETFSKTSSHKLWSINQFMTCWFCFKSFVFDSGFHACCFTFFLILF